MKQINILLHAFIVMLLLLSCKAEAQKEEEKVSITPELISDSIYTRMPGKLFKVGKYAIWEDPFGSPDGFMHVIDIGTKEEVATMGKKGQGPKEFETPAVKQGRGNTIFVYDLNTKRQALFSLDSLMENKDYYIPLEDATEDLGVSKIHLEHQPIVSSNQNQPHLFKMQKNESFIEFGTPYINKEIDNPYDIYRGTMNTNEDKNKFVFASFDLPYMEIYDMKGSKPTLFYASEMPSNACNIERRELKPNAQRKGARDLALLKDYIVTIQRDYEVDNTDESTVRMNFEKASKTVFLYNYKGELQKIVDVGIPIFRIAGDIKSNDLYAFGVDPEFVLVKCEL